MYTLHYYSDEQTSAQQKGYVQFSSPLDDLIGGFTWLEECHKAGQNYADNLRREGRGREGGEEVEGERRMD